MAWFADLAGKAESLLNNLDEQTGVALRNHSNGKQKKRDFIYNEPMWAQKKRPLRSTKKPSPIPETRSNFSSNIANRKFSPSKRTSPSQLQEGQECFRDVSPKPKKSPSRQSSSLHYQLDNCSKTLVRDVNDTENILDPFGLKERRYSLPSDLELINNDGFTYSGFTYRMQNLEVENAMLKNELNVMNREVSELLDRLRRTEDGNNVDSCSSSQELNNTHTKLETMETMNHKMHEEKLTLVSQFEQLKSKINEVTTVEASKYKTRNEHLESEVTFLTDKNHELQEKINSLNEKIKESSTVIVKLENELRHSQSVTNELQSDLEKSKEECLRLEKDWETYKLRVKSMLYTKDNQIKALQDGLNLNEDSKLLMEQLESLKEERESLSKAVSHMRAECGDMKRCMEQVEARRGAAERVVAALRDALRDERSARNDADARCLAISKELKSMQMETGQTIASLRTALRDKEDELNHLRDTTSSAGRTTDTSALNVADYDVMQDSIDNEKVHYLTQMLVQKQEKIDSLLADNNTLRIQLDKLDCKYKSEVSALRASRSHSVLVGEEARARPRKPAAGGAASLLSLRVAALLKRYPVFRVFIGVYMILLHFWVITVLFTSTPEDYIKRPTKV